MFWFNHCLSIIWSTFVKILILHVFLTKNLFVWTLHSCNLADELSLQNLTCWIPPQAVFTRWVTDIWCAVSMVTERLLMNIRLRLWATWPFKYEDGWCVRRGIIYNFQEKQGLKYCDLPLHLSILTATFNISIVYLKVKPSTLLIHTKQCLDNYFTVNICSTITAV